LELVKESITKLYGQPVRQTRRVVSIAGLNQKAKVKLAIASRDQMAFREYFATGTAGA
jgi:hypothetical protein